MTRQQVIDGLVLTGLAATFFGIGAAVVSPAVGVWCVCGGIVLAASAWGIGATS